MKKKMMIAKGLNNFMAKTIKGKKVDLQKDLNQSKDSQANNQLKE